MKSTPNNEESKLMMDIIRKKTSIVFPAGNPDFREVRNRCAKACREFNNTPEDADPEVRTRKWLE